MLLPHAPVMPWNAVPLTVLLPFEVPLRAFRLNVPCIFPSKGSNNTAPPSLHRVPSGRFPCFISTIERSDSRHPSPQASLPSRQLPLQHPLFRSLPGGMLLGTWRRSPAPLRIPFSGDDRASQVPDEPVCLMPAFDPGGTMAPLLIHAKMLPSAGTASAPASNLSGLNHTAYRLPVYASQPGLPHHHATLGSRCQHALPGRTFYLQGPTKEFLLPTGGFPFFQA